jgi:hypothetical protein
LRHVERLAGDRVPEGTGRVAKMRVVVQLDREAVHRVHPLADVRRRQDHGFGALDVHLQDGDALASASSQDRRDVDRLDVGRFAVAALAHLTRPLAAASIGALLDAQPRVMRPDAGTVRPGARAVGREIALQQLEVGGIRLDGVEHCVRESRQQKRRREPDVRPAVHDQVDVRHVIEARIRLGDERLAEDDEVRRVRARAERVPRSSCGQRDHGRSDTQCAPGALQIVAQSG